MLGSEFVNFLRPILNWQVNSFSNFASFFIIITHNSPVNFKLIHFLLWTKGCYQSLNFKTFKCSGENLVNSSCPFWKHKSVFLQILHDCSVSWKITPLYFLCQTLYTLHEMDQSKCKLFETLSAQIKIQQILVIFETTNSFFFKFYMTLQYHET